MSGKSFTFWLIIFLCLLVIFLFWLQTLAKEQKLKNYYQVEIEKLNRLLEEEKLNKEKELEALKNYYQKQIASLSSSLDKTSSAKQKKQ